MDIRKIIHWRDVAFAISVFLIIIGLDPVRPEYIVGEGVASSTTLAREPFLVLIALLYIVKSDSWVRMASVLSNSRGLAFIILVPIAYITVSPSFSFAAKKVFYNILLFFVVADYIIYFGVRRLLSMLLTFLIFVNGLSAIFCLLSENAVHANYAVDPDLVGAWKGLWGHKNHFGLAAALMIVLAFHSTASSKFKIGVVVFGIVLVVMTKAKTVLPFSAIAIFLSFALFSNKKVNQKNLFPIVILALLAFFLSFGYFFKDAISDLLSDPSALTGRAGIWMLMKDVLLDSPFGGYGFGGVFRPDGISLLYDYANDWRQFVYHSHNGFVEIFSYFGFFVGFAYIAAILICISASFNAVKSFVTLSKVFLSLFLLCFLSNFMETLLLNEGNIGWLFFVVLLFAKFDEEYHA